MEKVEALSLKLGIDGLSVGFYFALVFLFWVIVFLYYIQMKRKNNLNRLQYRDNGSTPNLSDSLIEASLQVLVVFIGAILAIQCTSVYENKKEENSVLTRLEYSSMDLVTQEKYMQEWIEAYQNESVSIDELRYNARIYLSMVENTLFRDDVLRVLPVRSYSILLSAYRNINEEMEITRDPNIDITPEGLLSCYENVSKHISYFERMADLVVQYRLKNLISHEDFNKGIEKIESEISNDYSMYNININ